MKLLKEWSVKKSLFVVLFGVLVFIGRNINFSPLVGADNQFFTLFQFFGPIAGGFLGSVLGIVAVALSQVADALIFSKAWNIVSILRFLPMLFAVYYFSKSKKQYSPFVKIAVPLLCIGAFIIHPVGREVWFFSLYWLIPLLGFFMPKKIPGQLLFRSYGATFTAHAVGGAIWIWTIPMTAEQWVGLIPVVAYERFLFGLGIAGSYIVVNTVLDYVVDRWNVNVPTLSVVIEKKYSLLRFLPKSA